MNKCIFVAPGLALSLFCISFGANAVAVSGQGTWESTLQGRDLDGNPATFEAYYDTTLGITWLADARFSVNGGGDADGQMTWAQATAWAGSLNINGITGWRLPSTNPIDGTTVDDATFAQDGSEDNGYNVSAPGTLFAGSTASEMAYLFFNTLGNHSARCGPAYSTTNCGGADGWSNTGPFSNISPTTQYWSGSEFAPNTDYAWWFWGQEGRQAFADKNGFEQAWAVHDGDVAAAVVPVPAAIWLFGFGLLALTGFAGRKRHPGERRDPR